MYDSLRALTTAWLDTSQIRRDGVQLNRSAESKM